MAVIHGIKSYLVMGNEATWGTTPGSPTYYHIPVNSYSVKMNRDRRNATPFVGLRQRKHGRSFRGMPSGQIALPFYGWLPVVGGVSIAQYLMDWAFGQPETTDLDSKFADWAEGPNVANVRHSGLRVNTATLEGSADAGTVSLNLDVQGKSEAALVTAQALPSDREKCVEADFQDCTFSLGGSPVKLRSFNWQIQNNLQPTYLNSTSPDYLAAGQRIESLTFQFMKESDVYAAYNRAFAEQEMAAQITVKALHNGTGGSGNFTKVTIDFPRLAFVNNDDQRTMTSLMEHGLTFDVLKPDTADNAVALTWSEE